MRKTIKKVCVFTSSYPRWRSDFAGNFLENLFKRLTPTFEISVLSPGFWKSEKADEIENIKIKRFNYFFPNKLQRLAYGDGMSANLESSLFSWFQIPFFLISFLFNALLLSKDKEIIWSHWILPSGLIGAFIKVIYRKKHIITLHSSDVHFLNSLLVRKYLIKFIVRNTDVFTAVCNYTKDLFLNSLPQDLRDEVESKLFVLHLGVEKKSRFLRLEKNKLLHFYGLEDEKIILFLGRLEQVKDPLSFLKATKGLEKTTLVIAGEGSLKKDLVQYAKEIKAKVKFIGSVDEKTRFDLLALCYLLVVPSAALKNGRGEGLPVVILEAFSFKKPVIASAIGGTQEVIVNGYNGFIVPQRSPNLLREKIKRLLKDEVLYQRLRRGAAETAENFKLQNIKEDYVSLIKAI